MTVQIFAVADYLLHVKSNDFVAKLTVISVVNF